VIVSKEEILHIANLANLKLKEEEIPEYIKNLQDILNYANIVDKANVKDLDIAIGTLDSFNVFRKDEIKLFEDNKVLLENAPEKEANMFRVPKVL